MSTARVMDNVARGWNRDPQGVALGTAQTGMSAALWTHDADDTQEVWADPIPDHHILPINFVSAVGLMELDGRVQRSLTTFRSGTTHLIQAGQRPRAVFKGPLRCLHLYMPDAMLREVAAEAYDVHSNRLELIDPLCAHDVQLERIGREVLIEMREGQPLSRIRIDVLGQELAIRFLRRWSNLVGTNSQRRGSSNGGLSGWQLRQVCEYIDANLAEDISLAELASLVSLSPNHFCTSFRVSMGEPPHRYLVRRRIERAKELLTDPRLSVTEVALAVGFGSSAHFATAFRKEVGINPSNFRQALLL